MLANTIGTLLPGQAVCTLFFSPQMASGNEKVFMLLGQEAIVGVIVSTLLYFLIFKKRSSRRQKKCNDCDKTHDREKIPGSDSHCTLVLVIPGVLFFLAFVKVTKMYQDNVSSKSPILVGLFMVDLVTFGG
jgi:hypothetical protein